MTAAGNSPETAYSWIRLLIALVASMIGGVGMWSVVVVLPAIQAEFGVARGDESGPAEGGVGDGHCEEADGA